MIEIITIVAMVFIANIVIAIIILPATMVQVATKYSTQSRIMSYNESWQGSQRPNTVSHCLDGLLLTSKI